MNVLIDFQKFQNQKAGGINTYFSSLSMELKNVRDINATIFCPLSFSYDFFPDSNFFYKLVRYLCQKAVFNLNKLVTIFYLLIKKPDVFHPSYYDNYFIPFLGNTKLITTIHDMIPELYPNEVFFSKKTIEQKFKQMTLAEKIIVVSKNTQKDIIRLYPQFKNKLVVIHEGYPRYLSKKKTLKKMPFILYIGSRKGYKNFVWMINELANWLIENNFVLFCVGGGNFTKKETMLLKSLRISHLVKQESISKKGLRQLYQSAYCLVYPSIYEGFGLPILEAFSCNCLVLASNKSSLPEVGGLGALYFDPRGHDELPRLLTLVSNNKIRDFIFLHQPQILKKFSWKNAALETAKVYQAI